MSIELLFPVEARSDVVLPVLKESFDVPRSN